MKKLLRLTPLTLGAASGLRSGLTAVYDRDKNDWRVTWTNSAGQGVQATAAVGSLEWSEMTSVEESSSPPISASTLSGAAFPEGMLVWQQLAHGCAALRSGARIVGRAPRFPSASLILCSEKSGEWRDLAFADEAPGAVIGDVALAVAPSHWLAVYLVPSENGTSVCRVVELPTGALPATSTAWRKMPAYPRAPGMAGMMTGLHRGVLIAAGGANFPDLPPWENGQKKFYDEIYVLLPGHHAWSVAGHLPAPRAYAATVSVPDGILIVGGESSDQVYADTLLIRWDGQRLQIQAGPPLPAPTTCASAAVLDGYVYLAGGYTAGVPRLSQNFFWQLQLTDFAAGWRALPTWPGPTRALAVAAVASGALYLLSGIEISAVEGKTPAEAAPGVYLRDAFRYRPAAGWETLPAMPWSAIAAPSPAPVTENPARVFALGGVDGRQVGNLPRTIALPDDIIYYDVALNQWKHWPEAWPRPVVCLGAVAANDEWILPSGEIMAGHRTTETWAWNING